jgi:hypothetical protein
LVKAMVNEILYEQSKLKAFGGGGRYVYHSTTKDPVINHDEAPNDLTALRYEIQEPLFRSICSWSVTVDKEREWTTQGLLRRRE